MKASQIPVMFSPLLLAAALGFVLPGCSKPVTNAAVEASSEPDTAESPGGASPADRASSDPTTESKTTSLTPPTDDRVVSFDGTALVAAFAAEPGAGVNQADVLAYALFGSQTGLACNAVRNDFATDFAAHRNIEHYTRRLRAHARPMGYVSVDLPTTLGQYDFDGRAFRTGSGYGDGAASFAFEYSYNCTTATATLPDGSQLYRSLELEADNGDKLHRLPINARAAESLKRDAGSYEITQHLVFYPVAITRRDDGALGATVHVTKITYERKSQSASPSAAPTIIASIKLP